MQRKSDYKQWSKDSFIEQDWGIEDIDQSYPPTLDEREVHENRDI